MAISSKERVLLALDHKETDRIPIATVCSGINAPAMKKLVEHLGVADAGEAQAWINDFVDLRSVAPDYIGPKLERRADGSHQDIWGVWRSPQSYGEGAYSEISHYSLAETKDIRDLDRHRWPSPDWWDFDGLPDEDGAFTIVDRKKDMILRGGFNVYPREVEEVLYGHEAIVEAAVIGVPDARFGEEVKAVVVSNDPKLTAQDLIDYTKQHLAAYKYPRSVDFVESLPKGPTGKILKRELRRA